MQVIEMTQELLKDNNLGYKSFLENLSSKLTKQEIHSLSVLGEEFFELVDTLAAMILVRRVGDCLMLDLSMDELLWELQVFCNHFVRSQCPNAIRLKPYCLKVLSMLESYEQRESIFQVVEKEYENTFFVEPSQDATLV